MRICLYGMPTSGKTYILDRVDFVDVFSGSNLLKEICPDFETSDDTCKDAARKNLANKLMSNKMFIMDGHYAFGNKTVFTENDGNLYDVFLYLYILPDKLKKRMVESEKNKKYLDYDISSWQNSEIDSLREYCHSKGKDFYVLDNPPDNAFGDISDIIEFIRDIVEGYSCVSFASKIVEDILSKCETDTITLMDGDKTLTVEDTSNTVFEYTTNIFDGNFYTGFQSWKQARDFEKYNFEELTKIPVKMNNNVCKNIGKDTYILTSGHEKVWSFIASELNVPYYLGREMSAETKLYVTKMLQAAGKTVIAYGDGMNDYYMLKQADKGILVSRDDGRISKSLKGRDLEGLSFV